MSRIEQNKQSYNLSRFCEADMPQPIEDQFAVTDAFWTELGYITPCVDGEQARQLKAAVDGSSDRRIVAAPILPTTDARVELTRRIRRLAPHLFGTDYSHLSLPQEGASDNPLQHVYGRLLPDLDSEVRVDGEEYALGYLNGEGEIDGRQNFIDDLDHYQRALPNVSGTPWLFSVMNVRLNTTNYSFLKTPELRHGNAAASEGGTVEQHLALELMHVANDTPRDNKWRVSLTNEGVYKVEGCGPGEGELVSVAYVAWSPRNNGLVLGSMLADTPCNSYTNRQPQNPIKQTV
jgi:hypothetical protein